MSSDALPSDNPRIVTSSPVPFPQLSKHLLGQFVRDIVTELQKGRGTHPRSAHAAQDEQDRSQGEQQNAGGEPKDEQAGAHCFIATS